MGVEKPARTLDELAALERLLNETVLLQVVEATAHAAARPAHAVTAAHAPFRHVSVTRSTVSLGKTLKMLEREERSTLYLCKMAGCYLAEFICVA